MQIEEKQMAEEAMRKQEKIEAIQRIVTERARERLEELVEKQKKQLLA